jgi:hypothetical protein
MADQEKLLKLILQYVSDEQSVKEVTAEIKAIEEAEKKATDQADKMRQKLEQMQQVSEKLQGISTTITAIGAAMAGPFVAAANSYIQKAGEGDEVSKKWLESTKRLEDAQMRIGKVSAEAILPTLEKVATIAEKAAAFAEKHPGIIEAALKVGTAAATVGAIGIAVGQGIKLVADVKMLAATAQQLLAGKMMLAASDKQLAAARGGIGGGGVGKALGVAGAVVGGVAAGVSVADMVKGEGYSKSVAGKYAAIAAGGAGYIVSGGDQKKALEWFESVGKKTGVIADNADEASKALDNLDKSIQGTGSAAQKTINKFNVYDTSERVQNTGGIRMGSGRGMKNVVAKKKQMEEEEQQKEAARDMAQQMAQQRQDAMRQEIEFERSRQDIINQFKEDNLRAEIEYNTRLRRMREDAQRQMTQAAQQRDAISFLRTWEQSRIEQKRETEDYQIERDARKRAYKQQLDDLAATINAEQKIRKEGYDSMLAAAKGFTSELKGMLSNIAGGGSTVNNSKNINYSPTFNSYNSSNSIANQLQNLLRA